MKKGLKQILCLLLIFTIASAFIPVQTEASTVKGQYKIYTLPQKKWVKSPVYSGDLQVVYKVKIKSTGYYKIEFDDSKVTTRHRRSHVGVQILKKYDDGADYLSWERPSEGKTAYGVLPKGTYYLYSNHSELRFKYQFIKKSKPSNTKKSKAKTLKRGVNKTVLFPCKTSYPLWFKVKINSRHKIRVFAKDKALITDPIVQVYDSKGKLVNTTAISDTKCQTAAVPKGTYYIKLIRPTGFDDHRFRYAGEGYYKGRAISLTWNQY